MAAAPGMGLGEAHPQAEEPGGARQAARQKEGPGCSVQPRPSPQAALRAGTSAASSRRDRPDRVRPCAFREWKPAQLRLKWASNASVRRKVASCECFSLSEVRLGEGQPVAALSVDNRGLSHERARGMWMVRPNRRGFWRAQPSRTPPPRYGARRERAMARLDRHRCERFQIEDNFCRVRSDPRHYLRITRGQLS